MFRYCYNDHSTTVVSDPSTVCTTTRVVSPLVRGADLDQQLYESLQFTPVSGAGEASDGECTFWILLLLALVLAAVGGVLYAGWKRGRRPEAYVDAEQ